MIEVTERFVSNVPNVSITPPASGSSNALVSRSCTTVREAGPQQLWSRLERIRDRLNREGALLLHGTTVQITPDAVTALSRGSWKHTP
ncbi:hypothetical protein ABT127_30550 [Streptomyces sp. NPDC001904]|uniref:hypothetical protein n=1 Tax=Streptomyces sp. NPDC001904 TaxID=3154531 RepID=UPI0033282003